MQGFGISVSRTANKRSQMLCLRADGNFALVVDNNAVPLTDSVDFRDGTFSVDTAMFRQLVDTAITSDTRYTPSKARREARKLDTRGVYESWKKAYRDLKKQRSNRSDVWYAQQIAKMDVAAGRNAETIRKHMKK